VLYGTFEHKMACMAANVVRSVTVKKTNVLEIIEIQTISKEL